MMDEIILDAGPLIAMLDADDQQHSWASVRVKELTPPLLTCEAVLTEAAFLLRSVPHAIPRLFGFLERGAIQPIFHLDHEIQSVSVLMAKYHDLPMSLADACLVRMAELHPRAKVLTLDRHFRIYRLGGRRTVPLIIPDQM